MYRYQFDQLYIFIVSNFVQIHWHSGRVVNALACYRNRLSAKLIPSGACVRITRVSDLFLFSFANSIQGEYFEPDGVEIDFNLSFLTGCHEYHGMRVVGVKTCLMARRHDVSHHCALPQTGSCFISIN